MANLKPTQKVQAGGYSGAVAIIVLHWLQQYGIDVPPLVAAAVTLLIAGAGAWIKTEGSGWFKCRKRGEHDARY